MLEKTWNAFVQDINNEVLLSGRPINSIRLLKQVRLATVISAFAIIPFSIYLVSTISPLFVSLNMVWILLLAFPKLQQSNISQDRKNKVEQELPPFVVFSSVMQGVGINLYESIQLSVNTNLFKAIRKEAMLLRRNVEFFGLSQMEALEELGRTHKSQNFSNLVLGYTSIWRSGGDLTNYLESRAEEFFVLLKEKYQSYATKVGTVIEILVTMLIILPIMIMVASFIVPGSSMEQMALMVTIGLPILAVIIGIVVSSIQPPSFNIIGLNYVSVLVLGSLGIATGIVSHYFFELDLWLAIALGFLVPTTISSIIVGRQKAQITKLEDSTPQFLRDMTEYKKIGYDLLIAFSKVGRESSYSQAFTVKFREIYTLIEHGISPINSVMGTNFRSWITKMSFFILAYISEFGGGSPRILETITRFITNIRQSIREGTSSISVLVLLVFVAPVIMVFTAGILQNILSSFDSSIFEFTQQTNTGAITSDLGLSSNFINLVTITPEFMSMIKIMIVTSSVLSAFVISRAIDFTFYNTWRVAVVTVIAIASIYFMEGLAKTDFDFQTIMGGNPFG
ncbi:MAG: Type II secretion system F protein [Nitrosopumilaceae archaeon]|nr:type II secretion system F family protein [Nitrosopumilaceae archaeon]NIU00051.1 type II secretion system F family protein [Nitrosopumilaceae archaeon]NIU86430.1 Type II secretion system F protein [Nitrosopumilaceae archaeon]NIV65139.1 Type II secretion system F protein [Nitrosopumilaceae archaeon]NIX60653.1 Type II secretion system F protein [Nitrosopumilaceae archaeon]